MKDLICQCGHTRFQHLEENDFCLECKCLLFIDESFVHFDADDNKDWTTIQWRVGKRKAKS